MLKRLPNYLFNSIQTGWLRNFLPSESIYYADFYMGLERNFKTVSASPLRGYFGIRELSDVVDVSDVEKYCG